MNMESGSTKPNTIPISGKLDDRKNVTKEPKPFEELPPDIQRILEDRKHENRSKKTTLRMLEGKYVLSILCYVNEMSPVVKSDIYNNISRANNMPKKLDDLAELGLIRIYKTSKTNTNVIVITNKGKLIADQVMMMVNTIDKEMPDLD